MNPALRSSIRMGLIGGVVVIYLGMVGMLEAFKDRPIITGLVQFSLLLIFFTLGGMGLAAGRPGKQREAVQPPLVAGMVAGAVGGALVGVFFLLIDYLRTGLEWDVRSVFASVSPTLVDLMSFGRGVGVATGILIAGGAAAGAVMGSLNLLDKRKRTITVTALMAGLIGALGAPLFKVMFDGLKVPNRWLFERDGLTLTGFVVVVVVFALLRYAGLRLGGPRQALLKLPGTNQRNVKVVTVLLSIALLAVLPWIVNENVSSVLGFVGVYILLGLGLNIVVGYAGLLDLGYVAFYAVGAYSVAVFTATTSYLVGGTVNAPAAAGFTNFWIAVPVTVLIAVAIGVAIGAPVLRLRGDYLAIVTLGFGEIIRTLVLSDWLKAKMGGPQGITNVAAVPFFGLDTRNAQILYYLIFGFAALAFFVAVRLKTSRVGRAWAAMREDEDIAEGMGISVIKYKLLAFAAGAAVGCLGGAFFAAKLSVANPGSFTLLVSINVLAVVVLGGIGSIPGVVVGSLVLVGLPELLREFGEFRLHIYGAILIAIMLIKPEGLIPDKRRALELHQDDHQPKQAVLSAAETEGLQ